MSLSSLPWFHSTSLQRRFEAHVHASALAGEIDDEERQWLALIDDPQRDHQPQAARQIRFDWISAYSRDAGEVHLPACVRLSRAGVSAVVMLYHPLLGLRRFADGLQLKEFLRQHLAAGTTGQALRFGLSAERQTALRARPAQEFAATLHSADVFQAMMLRLHAGLTDNLGQMRQWVRGQPGPDELLTHQAEAGAAGALLSRYWQNASGGQPSRSALLSMALHTTLLHTLTRQHSAGQLDTLEHQRLCAWLGAEAHPAPAALLAFTLDVSSLDDRTLSIDDALVLATADAAGPCYLYSAADGLRRFESRQALLSELADPLQRNRWLSRIRNSQQPHLADLRINALCLHRASDPTLTGYVQRLLAMQRANLDDGLQYPGKHTPDSRCRSALALEQCLDGHLRTLAPLYPADARDDPASLKYLGSAALQSVDEPEQLLLHLADLDEQYSRYRERGPDLTKATHAVLQLALAYVLDERSAALAVHWPGLDLPQALWQGTPSLASLGTGPAFVVTAQGVQTPVEALGAMFMQHILITGRQRLREELQNALIHQQALAHGYRFKLQRLLDDLQQKLTRTANADSNETAPPAPNGSTAQAQWLQTFDRVMAEGWPPACLPELLRPTRLPDALALQLQHLNRLARSKRLQQILPDWLARAPARQRQGYIDTLGYTLLSSPSEDDYLFGIADIGAYAEQRLQARLDTDFAPGRFLPNTVFIRTARYIAAPSLPGDIPSGQPAATISHRQSLVQYALNHSHNWDDTITAIELGDGHPAPAVLSTTYLRALVRQLDVGLHYQTLLGHAFDPSSRDYPRRVELFCRQLPGQLLETAWRAHLQGKLPEDAVTLISTVMLQPEGRLRQASELGTVDFMPLQLIPAAGSPTDQVPHAYLLRTRTGGCQVLYLPYDPTVTLQAFADDQALLDALIHDTALQRRLLARMPDDWRARYDHGGFREAHVSLNSDSNFDFSPSPGPVRLGTVPMTGNALHFLFEDNARFLLAQARTQSTTAAQARWTTFVNVTSLVWDQLSMFLPGRLGQLVAAWQLELKTLNIAQALAHRDWGQTLLELTCALLQGIPLGHASKPVEPAERFWKRLQENQEYGLSLAAYETPRQALRELYFEASTVTYAQHTGSRHFVALRGRLYGACQEQSHWYLAGRPDDDLGPRLLLDPHAGWVVDPGQALPLHMGGVPSSLGGRLIRWTLSRDEIVVLAVGTRKIRQLMPLRADMLVTAHREAMTYLGTALSNLRRIAESAGGGAETIRILKRFFGVAQVDSALLQRVRQTLDKMALVMGSRAYAPDTSKRYVMGRKLGTASSVGIAFMSVQDPQKQLFLLDDFFEFDMGHHLPLQHPFTADQADAISQAVVLLHEFSHIACNTRDIHYLEAATPYTERMRPGVRRAWLARQHDESFSHLTPSRRLFVVRDGHTGQVRSIRNEDRKGRAMILNLAAAPNLDDARQRFLADADIRSKIMLMNADSVALLIYRLGRAVDAG